MNNYFGDYHCHTTYSDCRNTVEGVVKTAISRGLKEIAITDHGYANYTLSLTPKSFDKQKKEIESIRKKYKDIKIYHGIEADILDFAGTVDMTFEQMDKLDIMLCGFHRFVRSTSKESKKNFIIYNGFLAKTFKPSQEIIEKNTMAFIRAIENYPIDIITHIDHLANVNAKAICETASKYGTLIELNTKHIDVVEKNIKDMLDTPCKFIANSDSHSYKTIGDFEIVDNLIKKYDIPTDRIVNYQKIPVFTRLNQYKENRRSNGQAKY